MAPGPLEQIWDGTDRGLTEAPHIFKRNGYYYLTTAEGGTGYNYAVSMARSRSIFGPYEGHPKKHLMCAANAPDHPVQRTGHGQYVETHDGQHYHSFLMGRPIPGLDGGGRFCPLGRETGIERCVWGEDGWLYLEASGLLVRERLPTLRRRPQRGSITVSTVCQLISNGFARLNPRGCFAVRTIWC